MVQYYSWPNRTVVIFIYYIPRWNSILPSLPLAKPMEWLDATAVWPWLKKPNSTFMCSDALQSEYFWGGKQHCGLSSTMISTTNSHTGWMLLQPDLGKGTLQDSVVFPVVEAHTIPALNHREAWPRSFNHSLVAVSHAVTIRSFRFIRYIVPLIRLRVL